MTEITGRCLCGAVQFRATAEPMATRTCWCRLCQKIGAGSATVNVVFPKEAVSIDGVLSDYVCVADSGATMHRRFCPQCGTPMFSEAEERPGMIVVRAGVLDDREIGRPATTIWAAEAPRWACIDDSLPRFGGPTPVR